MACKTLKHAINSNNRNNFLLYFGICFIFVRFPILLQYDSADKMVYSSIYLCPSGSEIK